jgi:hypothetical protein
MTALFYIVFITNIQDKLKRSLKLQKDYPTHLEFVQRFKLRKQSKIYIGDVIFGYS